MRLLVERSIVSSVAVILAGSALAAEPLQPLPAAKELPGTLRFHGHYQHRSRGKAIDQPSELWIRQKPDGSIVALAQLPFTASMEMVCGDKDNRLRQFQLRKASEGDKPGYGIDLELSEGKAQLTRRGVRADCDKKALTIPAGASFDPNSRPDSYCAANLLMRQFGAGDPAEAKEFKVFDWDKTGEALADYTIKIECKGKEKLQVPAGTFEARHFIQTQATSANTWFRKAAGHVTEFWILEDGTIVRILRHREPYELVLLNYDVPAALPGRQ